MKKAHAIFLFLLSTLAASHESASADDAVFVPNVKLSTEGFALHEWCQLGPFTSGFGETSVDKDFLNSAGVRETGLTSDQLHKLCIKAGPLEASVVKANEEGWVNLYDLYDGGREDRKGAPETAVYLGSQLVSAGEADAWLMLRPYSDNKVWLNGRLLHVCKEPCPEGVYDKSIRLPLNAGVNLLLIKLGKVNRGAFVAARIEPTLAFATREALKQTDRLLKRPIVKPGQALKLVLAAIPESARLAGEIKIADGAPVREFVTAPEASIDVSGLQPGLYRLIVNGYGNRAEEGFYIGTMTQALAELQPRTIAAMSGAHERVAINLETLTSRVKAASKPRERRADEPPVDARERERMRIYTEQSTVDAMLELADTLSLLASKAEAFKNPTGLHLRGFRSRIDDQVQHYQLFVPSSYRAEGVGLPLMVVPVTPFTKEGPYIESYFINTRKGAEYWTKAAETLGLAILWPGYRTPPYGNPLDLTHVDEALEALSKDYKIDASRLYLFGSCGSGLTVSMQAVRHPGRYAAIAYQHPVLHRVKNRYDENLEYRQYPLYQDWLRETDPMESLAAMPDLPIWIVHDSDDPLSGPLSHSVDLVQLARAAGHQPIFERIHPRDRLYDSKLIEKQMTWLVKHRNPRPGTLDIAKEPATGPLSRVFAERFIVVKGTQGSDAERQLSDRWYKDFCDAWQNTNYAPCRTVNDVDLQEAEEQASNLVLIGNIRTNAVWARLAEQLPIELSQGSISVKGQSWSGEALALQGWVPHPHSEGRKIALVGSSDLKRGQVGTMELWVDGWFDFAIWAINAAGKPELHHVGRYAPGNGREGRSPEMAQR